MIPDLVPKNPGKSPMRRLSGSSIISCIKYVTKNPPDDVVFDIGLGASNYGNLEKLALKIGSRVPPGSVIVPIPDSNGSMELSNAIGQILNKSHSVISVFESGVCSLEGIATTEIGKTGVIMGVIDGASIPDNSIFLIPLVTDTQSIEASRRLAGFDVAILSYCSDGRLSAEGTINDVHPSVMADRYLLNNYKSMSTDDVVKALCNTLSPKRCMESIDKSFFTKEFVDLLLEKDPGRFLSKVPLSALTLKSCEDIVKKNPDLIDRVPDQFISEEMLYRCVRYNGSLISGSRYEPIISKRIVDEIILGDIENMAYLPESLVDKNALISCFNHSARLPSSFEADPASMIKALAEIELNKALLVNSSEKQATHSKWHQIGKDQSKDLNTDEIVSMYLSDESVSSIDRACVFLAKGLCDPLVASRHLHNDFVAGLVIDIHGARSLANSAPRASRGRLLEASLGL